MNGVGEAILMDGDGEVFARRMEYERVPRLFGLHALLSLACRLLVLSKLLRILLKGNSLHI